MSADGGGTQPCDLLSERARSLLKHRRRVRRDAKPTAIHDLRVASRRLQEALVFFSPWLPARDRRRLNRRLKRIRRELGEARDADVALAVLRRVVARLAPAPQFDWTALRAELERPEGAHPEQSSTSRLIHPPPVRRRLRRVLERARRASSRAIAERGEHVISRRLERLREALAEASGGGTSELHALRIRIKRYRYALELLQERGDPRRAAAVVEARRLQRLLGQLRDLDLTLSLLPRLESVAARSALARKLKEDRGRLLERTRQALRLYHPPEPARRAPAAPRPGSNPEEAAS